VPDIEASTTPAPLESPRWFHRPCEPLSHWPGAQYEGRMQLRCGS